MRSIRSSSDFISGVGTGERSCLVHDVVSVDMFTLTQGSSEYSQAELLDKSRGGQHEEYVSGETYGQYSEVLTVAMYPGEFYIGDRRFVVFNEKVTLFSNPEQIVLGKDTVVTGVRLPEYPDGGYYINFINNLIPAGIGSPIIIEKYASGEVSSAGVIFGDAISSLTGYGDIAGYRTETVAEEVSGEIVTFERMIEGEWADAPWVLSPLTRFAVAYSRWRNDTATMDPIHYYYDLETNSIIFEDGAVSDTDELAIMFEVANEPFLVPINISPKVFIPHDGIICISAENNDDIVAKVRMSVSPHTSDTIAFVRVFVRSDRGSAIEDVLVSGSLSVPLVYGSGEVDVAYTNIPGTKYAVYDIIPASTVSMAGLPISTGYVAYVEGIGSGIVMLSAGTLANLSELPEIVSGETPTLTAAVDLSNENGIASFIITPSQIDILHDRTITVSAGEYTQTRRFRYVPQSGKEICYGSQYLPRSRWELIRADKLVSCNETLWSPVPSGVVVASEIQYAPAAAFLQEVVESTERTLYRASNFFAESGTLFFSCEELADSVDIIVCYPNFGLVAVGDGQVCYYSDTEVEA